MQSREMRLGGRGVGPWEVRVSDGDPMAGSTSVTPRPSVAGHVCVESLEFLNCCSAWNGSEYPWNGNNSVECNYRGLKSLRSKASDLNI